VKRNLKRKRPIANDENACVEDGMTHEEYMEHKYEKQSQEQRKKYGESNRDIEEKSLNDHLKARGDGHVR